MVLNFKFIRINWSLKDIYALTSFIIQSYPSENPTVIVELMKKICDNDWPRQYNINPIPSRLADVPSDCGAKSLGGVNTPVGTWLEV